MGGAHAHGPGGADPPGEDDACAQELLQGRVDRAEGLAHGDGTLPQGELPAGVRTEQPEDPHLRLGAQEILEHESPTGGISIDSSIACTIYRYINRRINDCRGPYAAASSFTRPARPARRLSSPRGAGSGVHRRRLFDASHDDPLSPGRRFRPIRIRPSGRRSVGAPHRRCEERHPGGRHPRDGPHRTRWPPRRSRGSRPP